MYIFYEGNVPDENDSLKIGKEIIDTANRFGGVTLKMALEADLVAYAVLFLSPPPKGICASLYLYILFFV